MVHFIFYIENWSVDSIEQYFEMSNLENVTII